jgi:hypothetical protein
MKRKQATLSNKINISWLGIFNLFDSRDVKGLPGFFDFSYVNSVFALNFLQPFLLLMLLSFRKVLISSKQSCKTLLTKPFQFESKSSLYLNHGFSQSPQLIDVKEFQGSGCLNECFPCFLILVFLGKLGNTVIKLRSKKLQLFKLRL